MEERIIDDEESRKIRLGRNQEGETDAVDEATGEGEVLLELPEEEYDEGLVGLTPSQLEQELARRKKAEEEARKACAEFAQKGGEALGRGAYEEAEAAYAQAFAFIFADAEIAKGLWRARTRDFTDDAPFFDRHNAEEFKETDSETQEYVRGQAGARLRELQREYAREEREIAPRVEGGQEARREAFHANRSYYLVRVLFCLAAVFLAGGGCAISAGRIVHTRSIVPTVLSIVFAVAAFVSLCLFFVFARKLFLAMRFYSENEDLASTEEGERLQFLRDRLYCLNCILGSEAEEA